MLDASLQGGVVVCQQWQLRRGLGSSAAQAWEAEDLRSGGRVAIRFLRGPLSLDEPARQRFEREARAFGRVRSPHYVQILDQGISEHGVPFLVTELLDGEDLSVLLARQPRLELLEAGFILDQLLRGLARLQSLRLVHREIRPDNVFLKDAGDGTRTVKLLDFGFARRPGRDGSPLASHEAWQNGAPYWSPEQIAAPARVDQRTDVWATGVLGYRMLTGRLPFPGDDWATLAQRVQVGKFAPVSAIRSDLPAALDGWFREMLRPELIARCAGAEPARLALEQILRACGAQPASGVAPARAPRSGPPPLPRSAPPALPRTASVPAPTKTSRAPAVIAEPDATVAPAEHGSEVEATAVAEWSSPGVTIAPAEQSSEVVATVVAEWNSVGATTAAEEQGSEVVIPAVSEQGSLRGTVAAVQRGSQIVTTTAAERSSQLVAYRAQLVSYATPELSSPPRIAAVAERNSRAARFPARATREQGVRVGTLLVCGLLLFLALAGLFALRSGRKSGLRSQAAAAEKARAVAVEVEVERAQPSAVVAPARAEPAAAASPPLQLWAAPAPLASPVESNLESQAPLPAQPTTTPAAAERLRSRSVGARLSSGPATLPVMEGGPRDKRSRKPAPQSDAPEPAADPPQPPSSAPPPVATRPYRGF